MNDSTDNTSCPLCGNPPPADAPRALCPTCLMSLARTPVTPPNEPQTGLSGGSRLGDYELIEEIARGGMGVVFKARQVSLDRVVAVKMILAGEFASPAFAERFQREAQAAARLHHPHIVAIHEVGEEGGRQFFSMDYIEGPNLAEAIARQEVTGFKSRIAPLVATLARAVHYAHERGVLHRDLKPTNILLDAQGEPHITDFGLAKLVAPEAGPGSPELTLTGLALGSPNYMPPEQVASRHGAVGPHSDIYSIGAVLFHLLTGRPPHLGDSVHDTLLQVRDTEPVLPRRLNPRVPRDLETVCLKCLEKEPRRRYPTALALAEDLERVMRDEPILARPIARPERFWRACRRRPLVAALATVAALLAAALLVVGAISHTRIRASLQETSLAHAETKRHEALLRDQLEQVLRLSDIKRLHELLDWAETLWPSSPERIPDMDDWLVRARDLAARLDIHKRTLNALRATAMPPPENTQPDAPPRVWRFADASQQWQHDSLAELVQGLEQLSDPSPRLGAIVSIEERLAFARTVRQQTIDAHRDAWDQAIRSIADTRASPPYAGLQITPQIGLVPLGRDPNSGLWEFAHAQTGAIPRRDDQGRLTINEETGLVLVLLPGGTFRMGAAKAETDAAGLHPDPYAQSDEGPIHEVILAPFFMSKYEMTQGQWRRFTGANPSLSKPSASKSDLFRVTDLTHPVEQVSWETCHRIMNQLGLALPTEAQWEYAARAGTSSVWWTGNERESLRGAANLADQSALRLASQLGEAPPQAVADWPDLDDGYPNHAPVHAFRPNPFGLHHVVGNVFEWCRDPAGSYDLPVREGDGQRLAGPTRMRVFRGGSYAYAAMHSRSAGIRVKYPMDFLYSNLGLRPARPLDIRPVPLSDPEPEAPRLRPETRP